MKGERSGTCHSASYMSQTRDQKGFTVSEVVAGWHELMMPQRTMRPSIARNVVSVQWVIAYCCEIVFFYNYLDYKSKRVVKICRFPKLFERRRNE